MKNLQEQIAYWRKKRQEAIDAIIEKNLRQYQEQHRKMVEAGIMLR